MPISFDQYRAVVRLRRTSSFGGGQATFASGVVFDPTGLIITNNHVIDDPDFGTAFGEITAEFLASVKERPSDARPAKVVIRNEKYDLAVLKVIEPPVHPYFDLLNGPMVDADRMETRVRILGYPSIGGETITATRGIISGWDENQNLKTDAEVNPGNSGGVAVDDFDIFLGIPSFIVPEEQGKLAFIVTVNRIRQWFAEILEAGIPNDSGGLSSAFSRENLRYNGENLNEEGRYPRIAGKFAAIETLLFDGKYDEVGRHARFILERRPRSALAYQYLGEALIGLGQYAEAVGKLRIAVQYDPSKISARGNLGVALGKLGRTTEALWIFEEIIDLTDDPALLQAAFYNIGEIYTRRGQTQIGSLYKGEALKLSSAAEERQAETHHHSAELSLKIDEDKRLSLLEAIVKTEIEMERESQRTRQTDS